MPSHADHSRAPFMLSVSGARGIVGQSMTVDVVGRYARALAQHVKAATGRQEPTIVIARDSRSSGQAFEQAAGEVLCGAGCRVIRLGVVATPTVAVAMKYHTADAGLIVTASHNPIEWNGLKVLNSDAVAPTEKEALQIIERFGAMDNVEPEQMIEPTGIVDDPDATQRHVARVLEFINAEAIRGARLKAVVDSINGAGCAGARQLLGSLGVNVVWANCEPTGEFAHAPEPTAENLVSLCDLVREHGADVGFAQDPDADRLATVDETGCYIGEEYTLVLAATQVLSHAAINGASVAVNLSSSRMIDDVAALHGATVHRTKVGEANVVSAMNEHGAIVGGEGNGGVIWPRVCHVRDSLSGMALILELMAERAKSIASLVGDLPTYHICKAKLDLPRRDLAQPVLAALRNRFQHERLDDRDGLRIDFVTERKWLHVRSSNTEPILRLIAEAPTADAANALISDARDQALRVLP